MAHDMTEAEVVTLAARHGLAATPAMLADIRRLSARVAATGAAIPRMDAKADEPAAVFRVPLPPRT